MIENETMLGVSWVSTHNNAVDLLGGLEAVVASLEKRLSDEEIAVITKAFSELHKPGDYN